MALSPSEKIFVTKLKDAGYTAEQALDSLKKQRQKKAESFTGRLNLATQDISPQTAVKGEAISQATEDLNAPSFGERFMENLKQAPEAIFGAESLTGKTIGKVPILKNVPEAIKDTGEMAIEGTSQMLEGAGDVKDSFGADTFAEGVTEASGGVSKIIGGGISTAFSPIVGATTNLPIVGEPIEKGLGVLGEGIDAVAQATGNALATDEAGAEAIRGHINNLAMLLGTKYGPKATESLINTLKPYAKSLGEGVKADFPNATKSVTDTVGKFQEGFEQGRAKGFSSLTPEGGIASELGQKFISSTAKIDPVKTVKFEQMTGKKPGEWLQERGVIAPRAETASALVDYWQTSKKAVDSTLAKIKGTFYDKSVERVLQDQIKYFTATADRANLSLTKKRLQTLQEGGLTLSEINSAKRLYESTEKLGYLKEQNSIKVERATNFDTAIREFLINTAEQKGFTNLRQLNKETQAAKFLADEIYRKMAKQDANNVLGLTDQMLAFGGVIDPSAWAALGLKKIVFGETGKSYIAKFLSPEKTKGIPSTPDELIELKNRRAELQESLKTSQSPSNKPSPSQANNPMTKTLPPKGNFNKAGTAESASLPKSKLQTTIETLAKDPKWKEYEFTSAAYREFAKLSESAQKTFLDQSGLKTMTEFKAWANDIRTKAQPSSPKPKNVVKLGEPKTMKNLIDSPQLIKSGERIDVSQIDNRRFMYEPTTKELVLGDTGVLKGPGVKSSHAEEFAQVGAKGSYDNALKGWIGFGGKYPDGIIHFAPAITKAMLDSPGTFNKFYDTLEFFKKNGANDNTVILNGGKIGEQKLGGLIDTPANSLITEAKKYKSAEEFFDGVTKEPFTVEIKDVEPTQAKTSGGRGKSRSNDRPITVYHDPQGNLKILDGNHRYYEALADGKTKLEVKIGRTDRAELTSIWNKANSK